MDITVLLLFVGILTTVISLGVAIKGLVSGNRDALRRRAENLSVRRRGREKPDAEAPASVKRAEARSRLPGLDAMARRLLPRQSALRHRLERTGRPISVGTYAAVNVVLGLSVFGLVAGPFGMPLFLALGLAVATGAGLPHVVVGRMANKRMERFAAIFPDAIDLIVRGLKSGLPVTESIAAVGRELPDPVGQVFRGIADRVAFGQTMDEALWEAAGRLGTPEFKFFVITLAIQRETGGNLGETLGNLSDILRRRRQMRLKIKAMSSEARASAMILGSLPLAMFGIIYLLNPDYESMLFFDPRGRLALAAALFVMGIGVLVMRKMVRFEI